MSAQILFSSPRYSRYKSLPGDQSPIAPVVKSQELKGKEKKEPSPTLHEAILSGDKELVYRNLASGLWLSMVNLPQSDGLAPLHLAAQIKDGLEVVEWLLANGADVNLLTKQGKSVLHYAAEARNIPLVKMLLQHGAANLCHQYDRWDKLPIHVVFKINFYDTGPPDAFLRDSRELVDLFLPFLTVEEITKIDKYKKTILHYGLSILSREQVQQLCIKGAHRVLTVADKYGKNILHIAARAANLEAMQGLLELAEVKTMINATDHYGKTALHDAAIIGGAAKNIKQASISLLLKHGATFTHQSQSGHLTAFEEACNSLGIQDAFALFSPYMSMSEQEKKGYLAQLLATFPHIAAGSLKSPLLETGKRSREEVEDVDLQPRPKMPRKEKLCIETIYDIATQKILQECPLQPSQVRLDEGIPWIWAKNNATVSVDYSKVGKWMLFFPTQRVNEVWEKVKEAICKNQLWHAKVSTVQGGSSKHVVIVYTRDYTDIQDVVRVHNYLDAIGLRQGTIYYKTDQQTRDGVYAHTDQGRPWIYSSETILELH